jgi:hypothetical protein
VLDLLTSWTAPVSIYTSPPCHMYMTRLCNFQNLVLRGFRYRWEFPDACFVIITVPVITHISRCLQLFNTSMPPGAKVTGINIQIRKIRVYMTHICIFFYSIYSPARSRYFDIFPYIVYILDNSPYI